MTTSPLLDYWQKPDGAGAPVGLIATSFTCDPDFFERDCLARFVGVTSVQEDTGGAHDLIARLELEEGLAEPDVAVLVDRGAQTERSSLRWDLLSCHVSTGLLHSKVSILLWEHATRILVGSANLTPAGYRHSIELMMPCDLGDNALLPRDVLLQIADEVESYFDLVVGLTSDVPAAIRARRTLETFRDRAGRSRRAGPLRVAFAPTSPTKAPLDRFEDVWRGPRPLTATHLSAFWDATDGTVLERVGALLTGTPKAERHHKVAINVGPAGQTYFPPEHKEAGFVDSVVRMVPPDDEVRIPHAKCLVVRSESWVAMLLGSSNHTVAGFGLRNNPRHRELNLWLGSSTASEIGRTLCDMIETRDDALQLVPQSESIADEDEQVESTALPPFFGLCRLFYDARKWRLELSFQEDGAPAIWRVSLPDGTEVIDADRWNTAGQPCRYTVGVVSPDKLPRYVDVEWSDGRTAWVVLVDDRHHLPPGEGVADLASRHLLSALASSKSLSEVVRERLDEEAARRAIGYAGPETDPLKRFDDNNSLLRRGRALAMALSGLVRRLSRPVATIDVLRARLSGPLGPMFISQKVLDDTTSGGVPVPEALFTIAEIMLALSRVRWNDVIRHLDDKSEALAVLITDVRYGGSAGQ